jgi:hypothetical protein
MRSLRFALFATFALGLALLVPTPTPAQETIHTYPMVSQFWTYPPAEFLKQPAYSRDYPPAKP